MPTDWRGPLYSDAEPFRNNLIVGKPRTPNVEAMILFSSAEASSFARVIGGE
jgi:hypothetical protein